MVNGRAFFSETKLEDIDEILENWEGLFLASRSLMISYIDWTNYTDLTMVQIFLGLIGNVGKVFQELADGLLYMGGQIDGL